MDTSVWKGLKYFADWPSHVKLSCCRRPSLFGLTIAHPIRLHHPIVPSPAESLQLPCTSYQPIVTLACSRLPLHCAQFSTGVMPFAPTHDRKRFCSQFGPRVLRPRLLLYLASLTKLLFVFSVHLLPHSSACRHRIGLFLRDTRCIFIDTPLFLRSRGLFRAFIFSGPYSTS